MFRDTRRSSKPEYRARYPDARPFLATRTGAGQDFTDLAAVVQLRLRVAFGLQALQRCSGLLNRRARGSTVAVHNFGGGTRIEKSMRGFGVVRSESSFCLPLPPPFQFNAPVAQRIERRASNGEFAGGSPAGCTNLRACG